MRKSAFDVGPSNSDNPNSYAAECTNSDKPTLSLRFFRGFLMAVLLSIPFWILLYLKLFHNVTRR
jgi:hypothetical protein